MKLFELIETNSVTDQNIGRSVDAIEKTVKANPETVGIVQQGIQKLKALMAKATGQKPVAEEPEINVAGSGSQVSPPKLCLESNKQRSIFATYY